jgi:DNA repair exonuclease SbcCD ATPase subunit
MSQQHGEEQVTQGEAVEPQAIEVITADEVSVTQTSVVPFNEEITRAKSHLNAIIDQLAVDTEQLKQRLDRHEPQTGEHLAQINALIGQVEEKLQKMQQHQQNLQNRGDTLAEGHQQLEGKQQILQTTQHQLEEKHHKLSSEMADELTTIADTLQKLNHRITVLEPTPAKLELLSEKLGKVDARLTEAGVRLDGRVNELERRGQLFDTFIKDLKRRNHRLEEKTQDLDFARKQQADIISTRSRLFGAIAALLVIAVVGLSYLLNTQQQNNTQQSADIATVNDEIATMDTALSAEITALDAQLNPEFDAASSAITIAVHDSDWVLAQKPEHLTIELYGSRSKSEAFNYIREVQHLLIDPVSYVKTEYRGRDWYVVFYGNYATAGESQAIMEVLPPVLRKHSLKVREFGWVQGQV